MNKLFVLLSTLVVLPVCAADEYSPSALPAAAAPAAQPATPAPPKFTGSVARAQFTSAVQDREPVDKITNLSNDNTGIYFFSEIKDAPNQKITHRWEHNGTVRWEMSFDIGGNRWRVYSNKTLDPDQIGGWKVSVVDEAGSTLSASTFTYEKAKAATPGESAAPATAAPPAVPAAAAPKP